MRRGWDSARSLRGRAVWFQLGGCSSAAGWDPVPGRPGRNSADAFEACQAQPQPIPECLCHRHRGERRGHRTSEKTIISTPPSLWIHYQFSAQGDLEDKQERTPSVRFYDCVLQHDSPCLISERLMHRFPNILTNQVKSFPSIWWAMLSFSFWNHYPRPVRDTPEVSGCNDEEGPCSV